MATGRIGTTPVLQVRWSKAPTNGTTSLSGLDDNSVSLVYSVGYEAVYRNGVLLSRGNDYTATNGTTVTLIDATITGDIIEIFANQTVPLSDTFSQTVADGRFIKNTLTTTTGDIIYASGANTPARLGIGSSAQVLTVSGGIPAWATPSSGGMTSLATGTLSGASITISSISGSYKDLVVIVRNFKPANDNTGMLIRFNSDSNANRYADSSGPGDVAGFNITFNADRAIIYGPNDNSVANGLQQIIIPDYANTSTWKFFTTKSMTNNATTATNLNYTKMFGAYNQTGAITDITLLPDGGNFTSGDYILYGVK